MKNNMVSVEGTRMKGQLVSSDAAASVFLFSILATVLLLSWDSMLDRAAEDVQRTDMEITATRLLDTLVKSPGHPLDWEVKNATIIGLARSDRTIDSAKLNAFMDMDYNKSLQVLGIHYNYFFRVANYTKGFNGSESVFARRMVIFNGPQFAEMTVSK